MQKITVSNSIHKTNQNSGSEREESAAIINNRVEAIKALSRSLVSELETLKIEPEVGKSENIDLAEEVKRLQINLIRTALLRTGGRQRAAARLLNVKTTTLHSKIKRFRIQGQNTDD